MSSVTDSDWKRLEDLIINGQKAMETRFMAMESRFTVIESGIEELKKEVKALEASQSEIVKSVEINKIEIKGEIKTLEAKIDGFNERSKSIDKIPDLAEKIGELKNWRSIAILILGTVVGWIAKSSPGNNP